MFDRLLGYLTAALALGVTVWALENWWAVFIAHV